MTAAPLPSELHIAPRRLAPVPPEATNGPDRPVPVTAYNHRCGYEGCPTWVPNHHDRCVKCRRIPVDMIGGFVPCGCPWGADRSSETGYHNHRRDMGCETEPMIKESP